LEEKIVEKKVEEEKVEVIPKLETKEELDDFTKIDLDDDTSKFNQDNLPDWLK